MTSMEASFQAAIDAGKINGATVYATKTNGHFDPYHNPLKR